MITCDGITKPMHWWADSGLCAEGVNYNVLNARISNLKWDDERAIKTPALTRKKKEGIT